MNTDQIVKALDRIQEANRRLFFLKEVMPKENLTEFERQRSAIYTGMAQIRAVLEDADAESAGNPKVLNVSNPATLSEVHLRVIRALGYALAEVAGAYVDDPPEPVPNRESASASACSTCDPASAARPERG